MIDKILKKREESMWVNHVNAIDTWEEAVVVLAIGLAAFVVAAWKF
jgi:hypothetical protein